MSIAASSREKIVFIVAMTVATIMLTGCAGSPFRAYTGRELPLDQIAVVRIDKKYDPRSGLSLRYDPLKIEAVDGIEVATAMLPTEVHLLPGHHEIHIKVHGLPHLIFFAEKMAGQKFERILGLDCEAGKVYTVHFGRYKENDRLQTWWIEDFATGRVVAMSEN